MFTIEPCQTIWAYTNNSNVMNCSVQVPKGSIILEFESNHLLVKHSELIDIESIHLSAFKIGSPVSDNHWQKESIFLGVVRIGIQLDSFAVFVVEPHVTSIFRIVQDFRDQDPDRIAKLFQQELLKAASDRLPPGA